MHNARLAFHTPNTGDIPRLALISDATSNAFASLDAGNEGSRQPGSIPKDTLHMISNAKPLSKSCRSNSLEFAHADSMMGNNLSFTSISSVFTKKVRSDLAVNSWLANLRCVRHSSPSTLNMPRPRRSPRISVKGFPLGKLSNLVFRMYSTLSGFAVMMVRLAPNRCTAIVWV
ncbi:hypothetical protein AAC387_Pa02g4282 [Persea americana]